MNCKNGDLAVVVSVAEAICTKTQPNSYGLDDFKMIAIDLRGCIFKCIDSFIDDDGDISWNVEHRRIKYKGILNDMRSIEATGTVTSVPDKVLRPIRDQPGEDETLTWAPVPHKETV